MNLTVPVTQPILTAVTKLDQLRGAWSSGPGIPGARRSRMREAARIRSVAASCRLSGIRISDVEVAGLLRQESVPVREATEILGYAAAMDVALPPADRLLASGHLGAVHSVLVSADAAAAVRPSCWRQNPAQREAFDEQGHATGRVYSTLPPRLVDEKMEDLLTWLEFELRIGERHAALVVGTFILGLLVASPFENRNGRLGRLLVSRLLERAGYEHMPLASVEREMEELRDEFHEAYDLSQTRFWSGEAKLEPWLEYFLEVLDRHRERIEAKVRLERESTAYPPLQRAILDTVREHGTVDAGLLIQATGANRNTLKDNLRKLVARGVLEKTGQRRGTRYRLAVLE